MSLQHLISVFADVDEAELAMRLEAELARRELSVIERIEHARGEVFPELATRLARHPGSQAFTFYAPSSAGPPTTLVHQRFADRGRWDPTLARALSGATGGWALALESARSRDQYGIGVFHAGCTIELDATLRDEQQTWRAFAAHYGRVTGGHESELRWSERENPRSWIVRGPPAQAATSECLLHRAAFAGVDADKMRAALAALGTTGPTIRYLTRQTPTAAIPYVILDGAFQHAWFCALALSLRCFASAVSVHAPEGAFTWARVDPAGVVQSGQGRGAVAFEEVWSLLTLTMGEPPAIIRVPTAAVRLPLP